MKLKLILIAYYLIANASGLYLVKNFFNTSKNIKLLSEATLTNPQLLLGAGLYASSFFVWLWLLSLEDLSSIYPIVVGLGYLAILFVSFFILKEHVTAYKLLGASLILVGILVITRVSK